jgi:hypothetical protein
MWSTKKKRNMFILFLFLYSEIFIDFQHKLIYLSDSFSFCSCCMSPSILHFRASPADTKRSPAECSFKPDLQLKTEQRPWRGIEQVIVEYDFVCLLIFH